MSIKDRLCELIRGGKLIERPSSFTGFETARTMIVTPEIEAITNEPFADTTEGVRLGEFAAWLDAFSEGGVISVSENCREKPPDTMLARTCPERDEFWSIRVTDPPRGIRALGAFVEKDLFVALLWGKREEMEFEDEAREVQERWFDLFRPEPPFRGRNLDAYLSNWT